MWNKRARPIRLSSRCDLQEDTVSLFQIPSGGNFGSQVLTHCNYLELSMCPLQLVVQSYWALVKNLSETDQLLVHLHSFSSNPAFYTVPEAIKSGVPLFYLPPNESSLVNASSDLSYPHFDAFWKPICVLDIGYWQRWLHCHRIGILLQHDRPLPKHLHLPSTSGRYHSIQCRQVCIPALDFSFSYLELTLFMFYKGCNSFECSIT